ncbi:MAG: FAD-binding protein [Acidobacteriota bacterium]|nr:FAD-binding protein [Acidobacteriota bacterium]
MAQITVTNWFGNVVSHPQVVVEANSTQEIMAILKDPVKYPSPVRAVGSNHSNPPCGVADGGTLIKMANMNKIVSITDQSVTAQGGALYYDIAHELEKHQLQFYVNTEIGSLSVGSAACAGTKDASFFGEYGQVGSYITEVEMVLPSGDILEVDESQPELLQQVRSSYGLFGIVTAATFRVRPILPMAVHHETFQIADFIKQLPQLWARNESMMYYIFPFEDLITVEFRKYNPGASGPPNRICWPLRNYMWATAGPKFCYQVETDIADKTIRYGVINNFCALWRFKLENIVSSDYTIATDQMIHYPPVSDDSRYTFSLWAFPEEMYPTVLPAFVQFSKDYYQQKGYRTNMLNVGYRISKDQQSLLSYSYDGNVMTVDPISTFNPGWQDFLNAYNDFCCGMGGKPLMNQTPQLTRAQVQKGLGDRVKQFAAIRSKYDPGNRLLNSYFQDLLAD